MTFDELVARFDLTPDEAERLTAFDECLLATAAHTNLVSRTTLAQRWSRHYADSLQLWPHLPVGARTVLDIGAGGGFPGMPLAILAHSRRPDLDFTLVDSVGKKARFLNDAVSAIGLSNTEAIGMRAESLTARYDVVMARAVASLTKLLDLCVPRLKPGGMLTLPKGARADEELEEAKSYWKMTANRVHSETDASAAILLVSHPERRS